MTEVEEVPLLSLSLSLYCTVLCTQNRQLLCTQSTQFAEVVIGEN
jgi:hypothetical protein